MPEELQSLLERIQKDGVDKAEAEADQIVASAREKASTIVNDAEKTAKATLEKAEQDADLFTERSKKALEQAARDVVLSVGDALGKTLENIVSRETSQAMTADTLKQMLVHVVNAYCQQDSGDTQLDVLVNPDQEKQLQDFFMTQYALELKKGLAVKGDGEVLAGFNVSVVNDKIEHSFSAESIAQSISQLLRPHLAEIVQNAMK